MLHRSTQASSYHPGGPRRCDSYRAAVSYGGTDRDSISSRLLGREEKGESAFVHLLGVDADRRYTACCGFLL
jgi:hypothetical protein